MLTSALTVRFTPEMREQLELVANKEHRPASNQVVHFVALGIEEYLKNNSLIFTNTPEGIKLNGLPS